MEKQTKLILIVGAIICGLDVVIGAFGAHALKPILIENGKLAAFETGVVYQMYHGLAIILLGILFDRFPVKQFKVSFYCMLAGTILFSGSLYLLGIYEITWLGPITPVGGVFFILGWLFLVLGIKKPISS